MMDLLEHIDRLYRRLRRNMIAFSVQGTSHAENVSARHMGIDHGGLERCVPQELLDCPDIVALFQEMSGKAVTKGVRRNPLRDPSRRCGPVDRLLEA